MSDVRATCVSFVTRELQLSRGMPCVQRACCKLQSPMQARSSHQGRKEGRGTHTANAHARAPPSVPKGNQGEFSSSSSSSSSLESVPERREGRPDGICTHRPRRNEECAVSSLRLCKFEEIGNDAAALGAGADWGGVPSALSHMHDGHCR